jgi:hypothetical protein
MDDVTTRTALAPFWVPEVREDGNVEFGINHNDTRSGRYEFESVSPRRYVELWDKNAIKFQDPARPTNKPEHLPTREQVAAFLRRKEATPVVVFLSDRQRSSRDELRAAVKATAGQALETTNTKWFPCQIKDGEEVNAHFCKTMSGNVDLAPQCVGCKSPNRMCYPCAAFHKPKKVESFADGPDGKGLCAQCNTVGSKPAAETPPEELHLSVKVTEDSLPNHPDPLSKTTEVVKEVPEVTPEPPVEAEPKPSGPKPKETRMARPEISQVASMLDQLEAADKEVAKAFSEVGNQEMFVAAKKMKMSRPEFGRVLKALFGKVGLGDLPLKEKRELLRAGWAHLNGEAPPTTTKEAKSNGRSAKTGRTHASVPAVVAANGNGNGQGHLSLGSLHLDGGLAVIPMAPAMLRAVVAAGGVLLLGQPDKSGVTPGRAVFLDVGKQE